jgi:cyclohexyl-isocyanide hydratase
VSPNGKMAMKAAILIFPGVEELDFVGVYEVLAKARTMAQEGELKLTEPLEVELIAFTQEVECANGMRVLPHRLYRGLQGYDVLIVPGGRGVNVLRDDAKLLKEIRGFANRPGTLIASVCTGAFVLAWAEVLEGRRATTHHDHRERLAAYCDVVPERVVVDGSVITGGGISASLDVGLRILEICFEEEVARQVRGIIEYDLERER